jgi:hypothetical protein
MKANRINNLDLLPDSQPHLKSFGDLEKLLPEFEGWATRNLWKAPPEIQMHAHHALAYLRMDQPIPACLLAKLAEHVAAVSNGRL